MNKSLIAHHVTKPKFCEYFMANGGGFNPTGFVIYSFNEYCALPLDYIGGELIPPDNKRDLYACEVWKINKLWRYVIAYTVSKPAYSHHIELLLKEVI